MDDEEYDELSLQSELDYMVYLGFVEEIFDEDLIPKYRITPLGINYLYKTQNRLN